MHDESEKLATLQKKADWFDEIFDELKKKCTQTTSREEKYLCLTVLPETMTSLFIEKNFNVSNSMVSESRKLRKLKGVLSVSAMKIASKKIDANTSKSVREFFEDDDTSLSMPGYRDCISMYVDGKRTRVQKRMMLSTLHEAYRRFVSVNGKLLSFASFAKLRPKNCVFPGTSGTHSVCVCAIHGNVDLMFETLNIDRKTNNELSSPETAIKKVICENPTSECYLKRCSNCPGLDVVKEILQCGFAENEELTYKQWTTTARCDFSTITHSFTDFLESFCKNLEALIPHDYIKKQQSDFFKHMKDSLQKSEFFVSIKYKIFKGFCSFWLIVLFLCFCLGSCRFCGKLFIFSSK